MPSIAIVGASMDKTKMSNKAVRAYLSKGYDVFPVHPKAEKIEGLSVYKTLEDLPGKPDVISLYIPPAVGISLLTKISEINPKEVFVNPGAENPELVDRSSELGLNPTFSCSITALGIDPDSL